MAYKCLDCGNKSSKRFPSGCCPACDSFNVRSDVVLEGQAPPPRETSMFKIVMLILFWALFAYGVWENYLKG